MFSKALVISAEKAFETSNPKLNEKKKKLPYFFFEYREAHKHRDLQKIVP
jgi:hypothetical protein